MSLRMRALTEISNWSTDDLLEVVQKNRFNDCCEPLRNRQIDGAALLSVTELNIKFWKLPKHREKDFFKFILEIKQNPEKFSKPKTKSTPKPPVENPQRPENRPIGKLALQLRTALQEKHLNSNATRRSPNRKLPPPPPIPNDDDSEIYENTTQTQTIKEDFSSIPDKNSVQNKSLGQLNIAKKEQFSRSFEKISSLIQEHQSSRSPKPVKKLPPTLPPDDDAEIYENTIPESQSPESDEEPSTNDPIYENIPQVKSKPIPIPIKSRNSSSSDDSFIGSYESLPTPSSPKEPMFKRPPQTPPLPPKPNLPPLRKQLPPIALVKPTRNEEKSQVPKKNSSVVQGIQAHFQAKGQKIEVPKSLPKPPATFHYRGQFEEKKEEEDDDYLTPIETNSSPKPNAGLEKFEKGSSVAGRPLPEIPVEPPKNWFQNIDRTSATRQIQGRPDGHFLFRPSTQPGLECSLTISFQSEVYNIVVRRRSDGKLAMGNEKPDEITFKDLEDIVNYYRSNPLTLYRNQKPVGNVFFKTV